MELKDTLLKLRENLLKERDAQKESLKEDNLDVLDNQNVATPKNENSETPKKSIVRVKDIDLNHKVDEFIEWYYANCVEGHYTDIGEYNKPMRMRDFIEKIAVWYELRYPHYEINRLMPGSAQEQIQISDIMFNENQYINKQLDEDSLIRVLDWCDFYNTNVFINSLPLEERYYFDRPVYPSSVNVDFNDRKGILYLTKNGVVKYSNLKHAFDKYGLNNQSLVGMHVKDVLKLFKDRNIELNQNNQLEQSINRVNIGMTCKEEMLNCVMYRIIERGGNRIGPRRAFLFAKEFGRNIDIPMMYAIDYSDPGLRLFMNEYIKAGGSKELECFIGYFSRTGKTKTLNKVSLNELILTLNNNAVTFYTPEEDELHQNLVDVLANQIDWETLNKEKINQLRLQRKLEKSRNK